MKINMQFTNETRKHNFHHWIGNHGNRIDHIRGTFRGT